MAKLAVHQEEKARHSRFGYYELILFAFLLFEFLLLTFNRVADSNTRTAYLLTYEFGFNAQSLIGSVLSVFTDTITARLIYGLSVVSFLVLAAQISLLLGRLIRNTLPAQQSSVILLCLLFLASPLSITYLLSMNTGRLDVYWLLLTLLALSWIKHRVLRWTIPLLCAVAISIHQGYMVTYMPALALPLFYEAFQAKFSKTYATVFGFSCAILLSLIVYFQFFPASYPFNNADALAQHLSLRADFQASVPMLYVGFFAPFKESLFEYVLPLTATYAIPVGILFLLFSLPLLCVFLYVWKTAFRQTKNNFIKFLFFLCATAPLIFLPAAIVANDWDRYWAAAVNTQFILLFYFLYAKEPAVTAAVKKVGGFFNTHFIALAGILLLLSSLTFSQAATNIFSFIRDPDAVAEFMEAYFNTYVYGLSATLFSSGVLFP